MASNWGIRGSDGWPSEPLCCFVVTTIDHGTSPETMLAPVICFCVAFRIGAGRQPTAPSNVGLKPWRGDGCVQVEKQGDRKTLPVGRARLVAEPPSQAETLSETDAFISTVWRTTNLEG